MRKPSMAPSKATYRRKREREILIAWPIAAIATQWLGRRPPARTPLECARGPAKLAVSLLPAHQVPPPCPAASLPMSPLPSFPESYPLRDVPPSCNPADFSIPILSSFFPPPLPR